MSNWIAYYSPTVTFGGNDLLQAFTTIGKIKANKPYHVDMGNDVCPFRRDMLWLESCATVITPLLNQLDFTKNKLNWGYQFRFGLLAVSEHDMPLIARVMQTTINTEQE